MAASPTPGTKLVAHGLVGAAVAILVAKLTSTNQAIKALIGAVLSIIAHARLDSPVASLLVNLGLQF